MVDHPSQGVNQPRFGLTDGWTQATVSEAWDASKYNEKDYNTWVQICWTHHTWFNRRGGKLDTSDKKMVTQRVMPQQIRQLNDATIPNRKPHLSLLHFRWGGEQPVNPVTEGAGGWGQIGSTPSDNYINAWEDTVFNTIGPNYEVISVFYQSSEELTKVYIPAMRSLMKGSHVGALYFMWPIDYEDGHNYPAYVTRKDLLDLMVRTEGCGIPTRFTHASHLYRVFASKEWTTQMNLHPLFKVPLTTKVARQSVLTNPGKAAIDSWKALERLSDARAKMFGELGQPSPPAQTIMKGVAKLGWSWEAMDVQAWRSQKDVQRILYDLMTQPGSQVDFCLVQEWVDFDVELRHFVVEPDLSNPASLKPKKVIYTVFKTQDQGSFRDFDRYDRQGCLSTCYHNDHEALADAERQAQELIVRWISWLNAQSSELPVVTRFDILCKRVGPGRSVVTTGELTELGGCFLGWPEGPKIVMGAMLRSCIKDPITVP